MASDPFVPFEFDSPVLPGWPAAPGIQPVRLAPTLEQARRLIARRVGLVHPGEETSVESDRRDVRFLGLDGRSFR